jgi:hypothetical protein
MQLYGFLPDASNRETARLLPVLLFFACVYAHAVLVILLPKTWPLQRALLPLTLWQAWVCMTRFDYARALISLLGPLGYELERITCVNMMCAVSAGLFASRRALGR